MPDSRWLYAAMILVGALSVGQLLSLVIEWIR